MTPNQIMLKAIVITTLAQAIEAQGRAPTDLEREAVEQFNAQLEALPPETQAALDRNIDAVFPDLLAAIDCIVEMPRIVLA